MVPSRKKEGFRWDVLLDGFGDINSSSGRIRSQTVGLVQRGKPQVGIGLPRSFYSPFDGPFVEELPVSRIITAKYQLVVPSGIIADNFQIGRPWPNPRSVFPTEGADRKSTRLNSSHVRISYAVFCLKKKKKKHT